MATKNALNKSSVYVQSLVDFILDTKPYHSKLTEIVEEYRFFDNLNVKIEERFSSKTKINSVWTYNYFSSANPLYRTMPAQRLVNPTFRSEDYVVGVDENTDLALVPFAYSKKTFDGVGVRAVYLRHPAFTEPLTESVDYFQSHGSYQFQIKQTLNAAGVLDPLYASGQDDGSILEARRSTRALALDATNPSSATSRIRVLLDEIQAATLLAPNVDVQRELDALYAILDSGELPQSYEALLAWLALPNDDEQIVALPDGHDREWYEQQFSNNTSPLFFGMFTDLGVRESGLLNYQDTKSSFISVSNISTPADGDIEEWTLTAVADTSSTYRITGSSSGFVGFVDAGSSFNNGRLSFSTASIAAPTAGDVVALTPTKKIVISPTAPLETWNIIKVNPIAHDRPLLSSSRFGHIIDEDGNLGNVTLLDPSLPTGDIILTSRGNNLFDLTSSSINAVVTVGQPYNDGKIAFTIVAGPTNFALGDRFYISIVNLPARVEDLDLGYGYDLDPYDDDDGVYPTGQKIGFYYDTRFTDFDLTSMNLQITELAIDGRKWHLRAVPNYDKPIENVDGIPMPEGELRIFYADNFVLEYSDDDFNTKTIVATIATNDTFSSTEHGLSFKLPAASRPYIGVSAYDTDARVEGGDIFSFAVKNPAPMLSEYPVALASLQIPRLIMYSDSFYDVKAAKWSVTFSDANTYTVESKINGVVTSSTVGKIGLDGVDAREGYSFKGDGVHFTIVPSTGLAAGDIFTFNTFDPKPSYLVHGSVTGFTAPATVNEYYWNGKIGFKLTGPVANAFINDQLVTAPIHTIREDCPSIIYTFAENDLGWMVTRADTGVQTFAADFFQDEYLWIDLLSAQPNFKLEIIAHEYPLWNTADVVILNSMTQARLPNLGDVVVVEKTEDSLFSLNITPSTYDVSALQPITIDQRFINTNTHGTPLSLTSPETALLQGWIPMNVQKFDSTSSIAEFSDPATLYKFTSAGSGELIGELRQLDPLNKAEPIIFEWDTSFYNKYLPLNAEANLVIQGSGWNDKVSAKMSESIKFLLSGGALTEDWLFHDDADVTIVDSSMMNIVTTYNDSIDAVVDDGPFAGFMPGYGNTPYDQDGYDLGQAPDLISLLSNPNLTQLQIDDIFKQWNNYLMYPRIPQTEEEWTYYYAALQNDPNPGTVTDDFGFPIKGLGIDITDHSGSSASASIMEAMTILATDSGNRMDAQGFDSANLDEADETTALIYSGGLPPIPNAQPGATYESFDTPLTVENPARVFEVSFNAPAATLNQLNPSFKIWLPENDAPIHVLSERISTGIFRFSMARPTTGKIIVS